MNNQLLILVEQHGAAEVVTALAQVLAKLSAQHDQVSAFEEANRYDALACQLTNSAEAFTSYTEQDAPVYERKGE